MNFEHSQSNGLKLKTWRLFLRALRAVTLTVDDWIQAQELKLREPAARAAAQAEVDRAASAAREHGQRQAVGAGFIPRLEMSGQRQAAGAGFTPRIKSSLRPGGLGWDGSAVNGARHSRRAGAPRLRYQTGQFVREGGAA